MGPVPGQHHTAPAGVTASTLSVYTGGHLGWGRPALGAGCSCPRARRPAPPLRADSQRSAFRWHLWWPRLPFPQAGVPVASPKSFVVGGSNPQTGDHGVRGREVTRPRACPTPGSRLFCSFGRCGSGQSAHGHVHRTCARCQAQCQHTPHQDAPGHKAGSATHGPRAVRRLPQGHTDGGVEPGSQPWPV